MAPQKVSFYVYADDEDQVRKLQEALNNFVREQYNKGVIVTADKLTNALSHFGNNFLVTNYLRK